MTAAVFEERVDPGRGASALLAFAVHLVLFMVLVFGVRWQNRPPESVQVELWEPPQAVPAPKAVEPPKPAPRVEEPPPPKPEPRIEKPEIVEKAPPPKKVQPPKPEAKAPPLKPRVNEAQLRGVQEELQRMAVEREQAQLRNQLARDSAAATAKVMADWMAKVRAKIRGNMVLPPGVNGNPETLFDVVQLPTGELLSVKLRKSSGNPALDEAIERAILKSSPLPKPDSRESPPRSFVLKYNPLDPL